MYEPLSRTDGYRVLVDRLWPRGLSKAKAALADLVRRGRRGRVTLVYRSHAGDISNAALLERMLKRRVAAAR